jgi:hypothetical protein
MLAFRPLLSVKVPLTVRKLPAVMSILPPADWRLPVTAMSLAAWRLILPPEVAIASSPMSPPDCKITGPPAVEIAPTPMLLPEAAPVEAKNVSPAVIFGGTFAGFARVETPDRRIKAGLPESTAASGSVASDKVVSGPVIVISPAAIAPFASILSEVPV